VYCRSFPTRTHWRDHRPGNPRRESCTVL